MCIFAVASTICRTARCRYRKLWIASKCVSLQWQAQFGRQGYLAVLCCELLQNVYLCSGKHNDNLSITSFTVVVNCFKMCIFAVASTISCFWYGWCYSLWIASKCVSLQWQAQWRRAKTETAICCELLQNVYLCSGKHNVFSCRHISLNVVNCFKMCIFAVASTIVWYIIISGVKLWIASKCVSLQWQAQ